MRSNPHYSYINVTAHYGTLKSITYVFLSHLKNSNLTNLEIGNLKETNDVILELLEKGSGNAFLRKTSIFDMVKRNGYPH